MNPFTRGNSRKVHVDNTGPLSETAIAAYTCPISMEVMIDPVITKQGYTFERSAILKWLETRNTCPLCRDPLTAQELVPNKSLRETIENYRKNGQLPPLIVRTPPPSVAQSPPIPRRSPGLWSQANSNNITTSAFANTRQIVISWPDRDTEQVPSQNESHRRIENLLANVIGNLVQNIRSTPRVHIEPQGTYNSDELFPLDIPENPDFAFLDIGDRNMIQSAYQTVSRLNKWDYMRRYDPNSETGYMFDNDPTIREIISTINEDSPLHSGASLVYTMRRVQHIAKNGFEKFKQDYCNEMQQVVA